MTQLPQPPLLEPPVKAFVGGWLDQCPTPLRSHLKQFLNGQLSGEALCDASKYYSLDHLDLFAQTPVPSPPQEVVRYRQLTVQSRRELTEQDRRDYHEQWGWFEQRERDAKLLNGANAEWLMELIAWAQEKGLPTTIQDQIRQAQSAHRATQSSWEPRRR